jgi:hypothetical protein
VNTRSLLCELENAVHGRNPKLASQLRPGLSKVALTRELRNVPGERIALLELYGWHNGTEPSRREEGGRHLVSYEDLSIVPRELLIFPAFDLMLAHFNSFVAVAKGRKALRAAVGRLFPFLWDGGTSWLTLDLHDEKGGRVFFISFEAACPIVEAYSSFESCLSDLIQSNVNGTVLTY